MSFTLFFSCLCPLPHLHFPSNCHPGNPTHRQSLHDTRGREVEETHLALATSSVSVKRKRCLSWVCRPVFSWVWAWPKKRRPGFSARKAWTRGHDSGLTGVRQLSLRDGNKDRTPLSLTLMNTFCNVTVRRTQIKSWYYVAHIFFPPWSFPICITVTRAFLPNKLQLTDISSILWVLLIYGFSFARQILSLTLADKQEQEANTRNRANKLHSNELQCLELYLSSLWCSVLRCFSTNNKNCTITTFPKL